mmetsp:Transcript_158744/g.385589  ORF Transcript_158744/g.385589 Transcript_158744/m.385589 type:complete len:202 (-) Transcript_158744:450-1055(-)
MHSASAAATSFLAVASPCARAMVAARVPSADSTTRAASPRLLITALSRVPSARSTVDRRSRSARIWFSMASLMSHGAMMLKISTRVMVTPQRSESRWILLSSCPLMTSRDEKVSSSVICATMLRSVACVSSSTASGRFCTWNTATRGSVMRKYTSASICTCTVSLVMTGWRPKSMTCSRMSTRSVTVDTTFASDELLRASR